MNWWRQLFCKHQWVTKFRGEWTTGVQCSECGKGELREQPNDGSGWEDA